SKEVSVSAAQFCVQVAVPGACLLVETRPVQTPAIAGRAEVDDPLAPLRQPHPQAPIVVTLVDAEATPPARGLDRRPSVERGDRILVRKCNPVRVEARRCLAHELVLTELDD